MNEVIKKIIITTDSAKECVRLGERIHLQLKGNKDYVKSNIILSVQQTDKTIYVLFFKECAEIPVLKI